MLFPQIKLDVVLQLEALHLTLSHLWCLENTMYKVENHDPPVLLQTLERKGFIDINGGYVSATPQGVLLYKTLSDPNFTFINTNIKKELKKVKEQSNEKYLEWINLYPVTAGWIAPNGRVFQSTRKLRLNNIENEKKYLSILAEGIYSHEDMCNALKYQVELIKKQSIIKGENKMEFMQGTGPYLNQRTFENFILSMKQMKWVPDPKFNNQEVAKENNSLDTLSL